MKKMGLKQNKWFNILVLVALTPMLLSWGTFGHEHINKAAVLSLPAPLQSFFYNHIDFITLESTVPDLRKYTLKDRSENPRHFIDLENYGGMKDLPASMKELKDKYNEKYIQENGILPWYILDVTEKLTRAFKEKRKTEILFLAADLGHYIGDAHMPLHTTVNHDGQATNQKGIHSFWESHLPELFGSSYNLNAGDAKYIPELSKETWKIISDAHQLIEPLLTAESDVNKSFAGKEIYNKNDKGETVNTKYGQQVHNKEYAKAYHDKLNGMVEQQMRKAVLATASYWYTAWVNAGKPDLSDLDTRELTERNKVNLKRELDLFKEGKVTDIVSESEF